MEVLEKAPKRGDIIWLDFNPKLGREQKGHRLALVISHYKYNKNFQLTIVVPISKQIKGSQFVRYGYLFTLYERE